MMESMDYLSVALDRTHSAWRVMLERPDNRSRLVKIECLLQQRLRQGQIIYPAPEQIFHALAYQAPADINVVILGQDPYHGAGEAMGLSFSVPSGVKIPPSLRNIYKEMSTDLGIDPPVSGDLTHWARQRVLLLNSVLTVEANRAGSHDTLGWQEVTDAIIDTVNRDSSGCVFLLWGSLAQRKAVRIDTLRHKILTAAHPSPLSAYRGFLGCRHFSQANTWLVAQGKAPIHWGI